MIYRKKEVKLTFLPFESVFSWLCPYFNKKPSKSHLDFDYFIFAEKWTISAILDDQKWKHPIVTGAFQ